MAERKTMSIGIIIGFILFIVGCVLYIIWKDDMMSSNWDLKKAITLGSILIGGLLVAYLS